MSKYIVARSKFLLPISDKLGRTTRIEDGYVLIKDNAIIEVGQYTNEIGKQILEKYSGQLQVIGDYGSTEFIPMIQGVMMPGFVKAHGHDHESPIIGIAKDVPLTPWLDRAVNLFTGSQPVNLELT